MQMKMIFPSHSSSITTTIFFLPRQTVDPFTAYFNLSTTTTPNSQNSLSKLDPYYTPLMFVLFELVSDFDYVMSR